MISGYLIGDVETIAKLDRITPAVKGKLKQSINSLTLKLLAHVKSDKLSGQVLHVRTGRLRRSINQRLMEDATLITGVVGTNVEYARYHEYGFNGDMHIREHLRKAKDKFVVVAAHTRHVNYPAHSFLRSALRDMEEEIKAGMGKALTEGAREAFGR